MRDDVVNYIRYDGFVEELLRKIIIRFFGRDMDSCYFVRKLRGVS